MKLKRLALVCAFAFGGIAAAGPAFAQSSNDDMKKQIELLQKQIEMLKNRLDTMAATQAAAPAASMAATGGHEFLERKPGDGVTFYTRGGEVSLYGNLDLSFDDTTKGIAGKTVPGTTQVPFGNNGWMPQISTNISYVGVRGFQSIGDSPMKFVYQLETQLDVSVVSSSGPDSNSNTQNKVNGGLTSRNSFIGLASPEWGAVKIGKTDAPYKLSTARMNPFSGMLGDYSVIMGNTGGDNRVEFGTRLEHSLWYESPKWNGFQWNALISPGQNRASDDSNIASGSSDCTGGNIPGSGGTPPACNDGSFGNAYSTSLSYTVGGLYVTGAYELHKKVNRTSDLGTFDPNDVADESASKIGAQYVFPTKTTLSAIYERMRRGVPGYLMVQNERQRTGYWLALSQGLDAKNSLHFGWAHANATPGDPGQHNTAPATGLGTPNADNAANMYTFAWKYQQDKNLGYYFNYAMTANHQYAHYDLGAGGRTVTTDCHDGSNPNDANNFDPASGGPRCWAGGRLQGVSIGMKYAF